MARKRLSPTKREALWDREAKLACAAGRGPDPICNRCDLAVTPGQDWDESHEPVAAAFGGHETGVAHRRCNREHGARVVWPAVAKSDRVRRFHIGAAGPGRGRHPMRAGRRSGERKTFRYGVVPRLTLTEQLARMREKRAIAPAPPSASEGPAREHIIAPEASP